jgi:Sulfatase
MRAITFVGCCYATALWIAVSLFGLSDDVLFFHSDLLSKTYFLVALGFLFLPAAMVAIAAAAAAGRRHGALRIAGAVPLALVLAGFAVSGGEWAFGKIQTFAHYAMVMGAAVVLSALLIWRLPNRETVLQRAGQLSRLVFFVALPFTLASWIAFHVELGKAGETPPRHMVMFVIDGMPSQLMASYAPGAMPTTLDQAASRGCIVEHAYTSRTYTSGYFAVLYTGDHTGKVQPRRVALPRALEDAGAGFRWISFHSNGFPEAAHVTDYSGLRSALLSERWTWLPRFLGLHYHVFLTWDNTRRYMGDRVDTLYRALNGRTDEENLWRNVLPLEIKEMQTRYRRSLLLVHVSVGKATVQALADRSYGDHAAEVQELFDYAAANDYTYTPSHAPAVGAYRKYYVDRINDYGRRISTLLDTLRQANLSDQTLVMVTADHGSTFTDGRLWYGPHSDEEVARVPLFLFGDNCQSTTMADTLDVRATLDGFIGLPAANAPLGRDLLRRVDSTKAVPVLSVRIDRRKTWFLEIHPDPDVRYLFNLHPDGDGKAVQGRIKGYTVEDAPLGSDPAAWKMLADSLTLYGIAPASIHATLRARIEDAALKRAHGG